MAPIREFYPKNISLAWRVPLLPSASAAMQTFDDEGGFIALHIVNAELTPP